MGKIRYTYLKKDLLEIEVFDSDSFDRFIEQFNKRSAVLLTEYRFLHKLVSRAARRKTYLRWLKNKAHQER